jgi:hypothetical protein
MKLVLSLSVLVIANLALADEAPTWRRLPGNGANCVFEAQYQDGPTTCGTKWFQVWNCLTPGVFAPATQTSYLILGDYQSDVGNECSPTRVVQAVVPKHP